MFRRRRRAREATDQQLSATGAAAILGDTEGWTRLGGGSAEVPTWTRQRARAHSVTSWRANPLARSIIDTYVGFCVGDSGVSVRSSVPEVDDVIRSFWTDPKVRLGEIQELLLRDWLLNGEILWELMVGPMTGAVRFSPIDVGRISSVALQDGNPLWLASVKVRTPNGNDRTLRLVDVDDMSGLRTGEALFLPGWRATVQDTRGMPFLTSVIDQLGWYDDVLSNLIDRTALARYMVWDVTVEGEAADVDAYVDSRGGLDVPPSGSVEVHNEKVTWKPQSVSVGAQEDSTTLASVHTMIAAGTGLAKTWLSDPDGANRATSVSMAEPVRRRIGAIQNEWLAALRELLRFVTDRAVAAGRLPARVVDAAGRSVSPADTIVVTGPEVAANDAAVSATVMLNLTTALTSLVEKGILTAPAAKVAAEKAWELYVGMSFPTELAAAAAPAPEGKRLRAV